MIFRGVNVRLESWSLSLSAERAPAVVQVLWWPQRRLSAPCHLPRGAPWFPGLWMGCDTGRERRWWDCWGCSQRCFACSRHRAGAQRSLATLAHVHDWASSQYVLENGGPTEREGRGGSWQGQPAAACKSPVSPEWINSFLMSKQYGNRVFFSGIHTPLIRYSESQEQDWLEKSWLGFWQGRAPRASVPAGLLRGPWAWSEGSRMCCVLLLVVNPCGGIGATCLKGAIQQVLKEIRRWQIQDDRTS